MQVKCSSLIAQKSGSKHSELTPELAERTCSNCFNNSGGDVLSISAPSIEMGHLTSEY